MRYMKYSIIIPVYNCKEYLCECVNSILTQNADCDFEILLVDDGSSDGSGELCDSLSKENDSVKSFHKINGGAASARNYGIEKSTGEYLMFIDGDDTLSQGALEQFAETINDSLCDMIVYGMSFDYYHKGTITHQELLSCQINGVKEKSKIFGSFKRYFEDNSLGINVDFTKFEKIHIVACGSAMHAGLVGKYLFENYGDIDVTVELASEYRYKNMRINDKTLTILISQSGETADTLAALRIAKEKGATTLSIVNAVGSTIARESDINIYTYAGPEIAVATTKGYTSQVAILALLCLNTMKQKNILDKEFENKIYNDFNNIEEMLNNVISKEEEFKSIANKIHTHNDIFFIGRGIDYALCMEGSLKLKEISYIHSEAYAAGELKHGTISLIEDGTPVVSIATTDDIMEKTISNIKETKARGAYSIFITTSKESSDDFSDITLTLPKTTAFTEPLFVVTSLQLIAYETAKLRECDIDKPKNLAKSVTVE